MQPGTLRTLLLALLATTLAACGGEASFNGADAKAHANRRTPTEAAIKGDDALPEGGTDAGGEGGGSGANRRSQQADELDGDLEPVDDAPRDRDGEDDAATDGDDEDDDPPGDDATRLIREMTFPTSRELDGAVTKDLDAAYVDNELTLREAVVDKSQEAAQAPRPAAVDEHEQGTGSEAYTESFTGVSERPLDVLLVLDNGPSMTQEARNMPAKLEPLLAYIDQTNWQIGVVTTDPNQTCLRALIKKGDTNARAAFLAAVNVGTTGSSNPRSLLQAVRSLKGECLPNQWIRGNSAVEVVFVSDQDNCVDGNACPGKDYAASKYLRDYLATIRTVGKDARVHGVYMPPNVTDCDCSTAKHPGKIYARLVADTGGAFGNICTQDYEPALRAVKGTVTVALRSQFTLTRDVMPGTLAVTRNGAPIASGFTLSGRLLTLDAPLGDGETLNVSYRYGESELVTRFALRYAPYAGDVAVTVNGAAADPASYRVLAAPPAIEFVAAPAARARIVASYRRDVPLQSRFKLDAPALGGKVAVTVDGVAVTDFTYDAATRTVELATPPAEGAMIRFAYATTGAPILSYPLALGATAPAGLAAYDALTSAPVRFTYANDVFTVDAADFAPGRRILVRYLNAARGVFSVMLPHMPVAGSVRVTGNGVECAVPGAVVVQGMTVQVDGCGFGPDVTTVRVAYRYLERYREFVFDAPNLPAPGDFQVWTVWVDNMVTTDYTRVANVFRFANELPVGSVVRIRLIQNRRP